MPAIRSSYRQPLFALAAVLLATLAACGGGNSSHPISEQSVASSQSTTDSDGTVEALAFSFKRDLGAKQTLSNAATVGDARVLGATGNLFVQGVPEAATRAPELAPDPNGRTFYVDSRLGSDANDGRAATTGSTGNGPWRTLARLMQSGMSAGDRVMLTCGSVWNETLRLPTSGTSSRPITVAAASTSCDSAPAIDGGVTIPAGSWTQHSGNIYRTTLGSTPLQVLASSGAMTEAHHPNRGYLGSDTTTLYALTAADGNVVTVNGVTGSTVIYTGPDLTLPAGASLSAGARVRVRTHAWALDDGMITEVSGSRITLAAPTSHPVTAERGYFLLGRLWMLDSAGEWFYDSGSKVLYAWMPKSAAPGANVSTSSLPIGIDLTSRANIIIDGLAVRRAGTGIQMRRSTAVRVRNALVEDIADMGADAAFTTGATFESNTFTRIGVDAISGEGSDGGLCSGLTARDNLLRDIGVTMQAEVMASLPRTSNGAIRSGVASTVTGNTLINTGYHGIRPGSGSVIENNFVFGSCSVLDDCAGIYVWQSNGVSVRGNTVIRSRGNATGKPAKERYTQAQGIYLDEWATGTTIDKNTVVDADHGVQVHASSYNAISNNQLYGNRTSQVWLQENSNIYDAAGDVLGNSILGNQIAAVYPESTALLLHTMFTSTARFGAFNYNRYYERASGTVTTLSAGTDVRSTFNLTEWRQSQGVGSFQPVDPNGSGVSASGYTNYSVAGPNVIPNANVAENTNGWAVWNQTAPYGQLNRESCPAGMCLRYAPGGSPGIVSSPNFSIAQGQWYRITVDVATQTPNQRVEVVVRRDGGSGSARYETFNDRDISVVASPTWTRYSATFQSLKTDMATSPESEDRGARLDFQNIRPGQSVSIANVEIVPITTHTVAQSSSALINASTSGVSQACPFVDTQPSLCDKLVDLANNQPIRWPLTLPGRSSVILFAQEPGLTDADGDGVPDAQDRCAGTAASAIVNSSGCSYGQR